MICSLLLLLIYKVSEQVGKNYLWFCVKSVNSYAENSRKYKVHSGIKIITSKKLTKICIPEFIKMQLTFSTNTLITYCGCTKYKGSRAWRVQIQFLTAILCVSFYMIFFFTLEESKAAHQNKYIPQNWPVQKYIQNTSKSWFSSLWLHIVCNF